MRAAMVVVVVAACGPGLANVKPNPREAARDAVVSASGKVEALEKLMRTSLINGGLWFENPACAQAFGTAGPIASEQFHSFAACLAELPLQASDRLDSFPDVAVLRYPPGIEIEARVVDEPAGPRLTWIGFESKRAQDSLPTISPALLESLRIDGDPHVTSASRPKAYAWAKVCIDGDGSVTSKLYEATSVIGARELSAAIGGWRFKPSPIGAACSMAIVGAAPRTPHLPPAPVGDDTTMMVPNTAVHRVAGPIQVVPDDTTKRQIAALHLSRITGVYEVCLDISGHVTYVVPITPTGFPAYDRSIMKTVTTSWVYEPYRDGPDAFPVCTGVVFIYSQH